MVLAQIADNIQATTEEGEEGGSTGQVADIKVNFRLAKPDSDDFWENTITERLQVRRYVKVSSVFLCWVCVPVVGVPYVFMTIQIAWFELVFIDQVVISPPASILRMPERLCPPQDYNCVRIHLLSWICDE